MGLTAFFCVAIGVYPEPLYQLLPYEVDYVPYTTTHVITQLQLLFFSALAFTVLMRTGIYPPEMRSVNLDFDWTYRKLGPALIGACRFIINMIWGGLIARTASQLTKGFTRIQNAHRAEGALARTWPTGSMVLWIAVLLGVTLLVTYI